jgi:hypothetical protein
MPEPLTMRLIGLMMSLTQVGRDRIRTATLVLRFSCVRNRITRKDEMKVCWITDDQATSILRKLCGERRLELVGKGRGAFDRAP